MNDERVAIVTGGGSGLGRELTFGLARAGFAVVVADIDGEAAAETAKQAGRRPATGGSARPEAVAVHADVREPARLREVVRVATELGGPHVLVNNAGGWS